MKTFELNSAFTEKLFVINMNLSQIFLEPNDDFPWIVGVPMIFNAKNICDLTKDKKIMLFQEIDILSDIMKKVYNFDQINIAMLGNITPQLHFHIVARFNSDSAWPNPVWGSNYKKITQNETELKYRKLIEEIKSIKI